MLTSDGASYSALQIRAVRQGQTWSIEWRKGSTSCLYSCPNFLFIFFYAYCLYAIRTCTQIIHFWARSPLTVHYPYMNALILLLSYFPLTIESILSVLNSQGITSTSFIICRPIKKRGRSGWFRLELCPEYRYKFTSFWSFNTLFRSWVTKNHCTSFLIP